MAERSEKGDALWGWAVKVGCFGVFIHAAVFKDDPNFLIAFLAICGSVLPVREFGGFLRSWRKNGDA